MYQLDEFYKFQHSIEDEKINNKKELAIKLENRRIRMIV